MAKKGDSHDPHSSKVHDVAFDRCRDFCSWGVRNLRTFLPWLCGFNESHGSATLGPVGWLANAVRGWTLGRRIRNRRSALLARVRALSASITGRAAGELPRIHDRDCGHDV